MVHKPTTPILFDIRFNNVQDNVIVLKGDELESQSFLLTGNIVLSLSEPIKFRNISIKINGKLKIKWTQRYDTNSTSRFGTDDKCGIFYLPAHHWEFLYNKKVDLLPSLSNNNCNTCNSKFGFNTYNSIDDSSQFYTYTEGNYEIPFQILLDGSIHESIEIQECCSIIYKIDAIIDLLPFQRPRFIRLIPNHNTLITTKYLRIIRQKSLIDLLSLSNTTISVHNKCKMKNGNIAMEYFLDLQTKLISIGHDSKIKFNLSLLSLLNGLKLAEILVSLDEDINLIGMKNDNFNKGSKTREISNKIIIIDDEHDDVNKLDYKLSDFLELPSSLSKCSQDVSISLSNNLKITIKHRLIFQVSLIHDDNHVSRLSFSVPIILFISTHFPIDVVKDPEELVNVHNDRFIYKNLDEETLFEFSKFKSHYDMNLDLELPPLYQDHVYDQILDLWNSNSTDYNLNINQLQLDEVNNYNDTNSMTRNNSNSDGNVNLGMHMDCIPSYEIAMKQDFSTGCFEPSPGYT